MLPALKNRYNKTGEDLRYQGTLLGKEAEPHAITIVGGPASSIQEWGEQLRSRTISPRLSSSASVVTSSGSPLTPMDDSFDDDKNALG
jgi:transcription initiation factor TFIID subunit 3